MKKKFDQDKVFSGSVPEFYETYLVPLIFETYAKDLARRVGSAAVSNVLEIAAGTGVVTRELVNALTSDVTIVATDLNQAMLDYGASIRADKNVEWKQADALSLPFEDSTFDVVVCQFAVMFFPDRPKAYSEALRVLKPGGRFIFNVWDSIEKNEFAKTVTDSLVELFPSDPPRFLARTPHGYFDTNEIRSDLKKGGFTNAPEIESLEALSKASHPSIPAVAYCQGTPLRNEIENNDKTILADATNVATNALTERFGKGAIEGKISGYIISIRA